MITKRDIGEWVRIRFWDHYMTTDPIKTKVPYLCEAAGMIREVEDMQIVLANFWISNAPKKTQDNNAEKLVIVRSTIIEYGWCPVLVWNKD
jgi:hypothetical protein